MHHGCSHSHIIANYTCEFTINLRDGEEIFRREKRYDKILEHFNWNSSCCLMINLHVIIGDDFILLIDNEALRQIFLHVIIGDDFILLLDNGVLRQIFLHVIIGDDFILLLDNGVLRQIFDHNLSLVEPTLI